MPIITHSQNKNLKNNWNPSKKNKYKINNILKQIWSLYYFVVMLHKRTAFRKTKGGKVLRVTREHYLRDDIWCGSEACTQCKQDSHRIILPKLLSRSEGRRMYPILHPSVLLHQIDLLENSVGRLEIYSGYWNLFCGCRVFNIVLYCRVVWRMLRDIVCTFIIELKGYLLIKRECGIHFLMIIIGTLFCNVTLMILLNCGRIRVSMNEKDCLIFY